MLFSDCLGFDWDEGNESKNWIKHKVTKLECEECFFNIPFIVADDVKHSQKEVRFFALGQTSLKRKLFLVFTIRQKKIRVISARDMNKNEKKVYDEKSTRI